MRLFPNITVRRSLVWVLMLAILPTAWWLWSPGVDLRDGSHDRVSNAIWMQHGWLADDAWLRRNEKQPDAFRSTARLAAMAALLRGHHIRYLFPHLCPARASGEIAAHDDAQVERFLDAFGGFEILPWVGGVRGDSARVADPAWRARFVKSCADLLAAHPRLAGVHVNIEPMPSGDGDLLTLLDELRVGLPKGSKISVAAYPPPTRWQASADVHWDQAYSRAVAARVDQAAVMMYDTSLHTGKLYEQLMREWTREVLTWYAPKQVLLGVPAYEDVADYHDPGTENLPHALAGIHAGLGGPLPENYAGVSVYCEWEMSEEKWRLLGELFERSAAAK